MKYRLKDKKLQRKLDEISGGDFSPQLQDAWSTNEGRSVATFRFGEDLRCLSGHKFCATFYKDEIEEIPEYDPNRWNEWPGVEPPEGVDMRVEVLSKDGKVIFKGASVFDTDAWNIGGHWYDDRRVRFRPWDDTTAPTKSTLNKKILQEIIKALESHPEAYDLGYLIDDVSEAANELPDEESEK